MILPRTTILCAASLTGLAALGAAWWGGSYAAAVLAGGAIAVLDFWWLGRDVRTRFDLFARSGGRPSAWLALSLFRMVAVFGLVWLCLQHLPPVGLLVGLGSVVTAIVVQAVTSLVPAAAVSTTEP